MTWDLSTSKYFISTPRLPEGRRYIDKLNIVNLSQCPFSFPGFSSKKDPTTWQEVKYFEYYQLSDQITMQDRY